MARALNRLAVGSVKLGAMLRTTGVLPAKAPTPATAEVTCTMPALRAAALAAPGAVMVAFTWPVLALPSWVPEARPWLAGESRLWLRATFRAMVCGTSCT